MIFKGSPREKHKLDGGANAGMGGGGHQSLPSNNQPGNQQQQQQQLQVGQTSSNYSDLAKFDSLPLVDHIDSVKCSITRFVIT